MADDIRLDMELLIDQVRKYPEIWNVSAEEYHDRTKKRSAWIEICRTFYEDFDMEDEREKNEICNKFIKKWRNLKDNFMKNMKRIRTGKADSRRPYIYARQMSFLLQIGTEAETQSSIGEDREEQSEEMEYLWPPRYEKPRKKRRTEEEYPPIEFMKAPQPPQAVATILEPNADRSFFESLLPFISGFTEDQTLEFRMEILNIVKRMRSSQPSTSKKNEHP